MSKQYHEFRYFRRLLTVLDMVGNVVAGGMPDVTVSARIGYKVIYNTNAYWRFLEWVVNFTFYGPDAAGHCRMAYKDDSDELVRRGNDVALAVLALITVVSCLVLAPILWAAYGIQILFGKEKHRQFHHLRYPKDEWAEMELQRQMSDPNWVG